MSVSYTPTFLIHNSISDQSELENLFAELIRDSDQYLARALRSGQTAEAFLDSISSPEEREEWPEGFRGVALDALAERGLTRSA